MQQGVSIPYPSFTLKTVLMDFLGNCFRWLVKFVTGVYFTNTCCYVVGLMNLYMNVLAFLFDIYMHVCTLVRACGLKAINKESESEKK